MAKKENRETGKRSIVMAVVQPKLGLRVQNALITMNEWRCQRTSAATECRRAENGNRTRWSPGFKVNLENKPDWWLLETITITITVAIVTVMIQWP